MPQTDIRTLITIENDRKGVDAAKQALKEVVKAQADLIGEFKAGGKSVEAFNDEMAKLVKQEKSLESAIDKATGEITAQRKEMAEAADEAARLAQEQAELSKRQAELSTPQGRFDKVSQDVALAGDAESSLRTITGAVGFLGGDVGAKIEQNVNALAEGFAVLEAAPKLKESLAGIPGAVNSAAQALGTNSAGLIGALGVTAVVVAATTLAVKALNAANEEARAKVEAGIEAQREIIRRTAEGLTSDQALQELETINEQYDKQAELLDVLSGNYETFEQNLGAAGDQFLGLGGLFNTVAKQTSDDEELLYQQLSQQQTLVKDLEANREELNQALANGSLAANDAAEAERELANERTKSVLASANAAAALTRAEQQTRDATQEQLDSLAQSERDNIEALKSQLDVLKNSGDTSESVASQIENLEAQLSTAEGRLQKFTSAVGKTAVQSEIEGLEKGAEKRRTSLQAELEILKKSGDTSEATKNRIAELEKELSNFGTTSQNVASQITKAASAFDSAAANIAAGKNADGSYTLSGAVSLGAFAPKKTSTGSSAGSSAASDQQKAYQDYLDKQRDFFNEQQNILLDYHRSIEDIERDFQYKQEDAASQRNFAAAAEAIRDQDRAIHDEKINTQRRLEDLANSQQQELQIYQSGQSAILAQTQQFVNQMSGQFSTLFNNIQNQQLQYVIG